ncbi:hypothetical protein HPB51_006121 [Rhipicephalus microplus]|uniref:HAT C-terminal dimerisation domain-containing protein n=1 Tax=Rhipicephalus microplus TaxID=6941 RepID=A0A9J6ERQ5_RHIMP|nr:hypothetical protein HPB51_006121 [Rhipicephalus microplus]
MSEFYAKLCDIKKHAATTKHKKSSEPYSSSSRQKKLQYSAATESSCGRSEAALCLFICEHTAFLTADHLTELCKKQFMDSKSAAGMRMHRRKCTKIIVNVLSPHFVDLLVADIGDSKYSLIIDEGTDISITKLLGVVVRYFSAARKSIVTTFLALIELDDGTAVTIVRALENLLTRMGLDKKRLLGIGVDNASVNTGVNNGIFETIKREWQLPNLIMVRCICHSLQLALSHAVQGTLPRNVDFLVRETHMWFSHSSKRKAAYSQLYRSLCDGEEPLSIPRVCDTRWISLEPAVVRVLDQWDMLLKHFEQARSTEGCYTAELLYQMYSDPLNKLYLLYLRPMLREVQRTNKAYERNDADPAKLLEDLTLLIKMVCSKVLIPTAKIDPLRQPIDGHLDPKPYLGYEFEKLASTLPAGPEVDFVRQRCVNFTVKLSNELRQRLPSNFKILQGMARLSVGACLRVLKEPITELAEHFGVQPNEIDLVNAQWKRLTLVGWANTTDTIAFWSEATAYRDAAGSNPFHEVAQLAVDVLSLPHSNAEVERVFSQLSVVKTKLRNSLSTASTNAVLSVRSGLRRLGKCCHTYDLPDTVTRKVGTMQAYSSAFAPRSSARAQSSGESADEEVWTGEVELLLDI